MRIEDLGSPAGTALNSPDRRISVSWLEPADLIYVGALSDSGAPDIRSAAQARPRCRFQSRLLPNFAIARGAPPPPGLLALHVRARRHGHRTRAQRRQPPDHRSAESHGVAQSCRICCAPIRTNISVGSRFDPRHLSRFAACRAPSRRGGSEPGYRDRGISLLDRRARTLSRSPRRKIPELRFAATESRRKWAARGGVSPIWTVCAYTFRRGAWLR